MQARLEKICCATCNRHIRSFCERACPFWQSCGGKDECVWHQGDCDEYRDPKAKLKMPRKKVKPQKPQCNGGGTHAYCDMIRSGPGWYCPVCGRYD